MSNEFTVRINDINSCSGFDIVEQVLNLQLHRMHQIKDMLFEKSQQKLEQNQKMHYLMKNLQALQKLDKWTHLLAAFKEQREMDPWYPVPVLENQ